MTSLDVSTPTDSRFVLLDAGPTAHDDFGRDVWNGLTEEKKWLPARWFYDALGSALFDAICFLPEYYVLRAESEVLTSFAHEIVASFGNDIRLAELGSGMARKTRILLDVLTAGQPALEYIPVDVDTAVLNRSGHDLLREYPELRVTAVCSDFARPSIPLGLLETSRLRTIVLFLGSTIGNLDPAAAVAMLRDLRSGLAKGDALFLGADLKKDRSVLEPAYDDALGVTAAFNLNILARINRELGGHFPLDAFRHRAFYNPTDSRIEMHLTSTRQQRIRIDAIDLDIALAEGETIHTESSYKHDQTTLSALAKSSGFEIAKIWTDSRQWFADVLMVAG